MTNCNPPSISRNSTKTRNGQLSQSQDPRKGARGSGVAAGIGVSVVVSVGVGVGVSVGVIMGVAVSVGVAVQLSAIAVCTVAVFFAAPWGWEDSAGHDQCEHEHKWKNAFTQNQPPERMKNCPLGTKPAWILIPGTINVK